METREQLNIRKRKERWVRQDNKQWAIISMLGCKCEKCGIEATRDNMCIFDFHHVDPSTKEENIAELLANGRPLDILMEEATKCILLCSNCHRQLHYDEHLEERNKILRITR